ncbi:iron-siderophore ABC transporter substrate-binding protein [Oculatella sp. LEGE 06141]|nr:iron-siderophore ABC transporter substrate-binding protein [Oculatella sp. LEGE 06141]
MRCKNVTIRSFIGWLLLGILGFFLTTACGSPQGVTVSSPEQLTAECKVVQHVLGETCIPANPQRIVTLSIPTLGHALSLGVKPIASTYINGDYVLPYLADKVEGIDAVGSDRPNLERLLTLKPDLIVGLDWEESIYPLLSKIAPTVLDDWGGTENWRDHFSFVAEVLGKQTEAQQAWDRYYQRIAELKSALGIGAASPEENRYSDKTISLIFVAPGAIFSEAKGSFPDSILKDVGLQRPAAQDVVVPDTQLQIGEEELEKVDGDILLIGGLTENDKDRLEELKQKPLWQRLRAVQQNRVYVIDYMTWRGGNLLAADAVIDDLFQYLVNTP